MKTVIIDRFKITDNYSLGNCYVKNECGDIIFQAPCIERGWLDNKRNISCVPEGCYPLVLEFSPKFNQKLWELKEVPNRAECKFHAANYWRQLNGCIALGKQHLDIDKDGDPDVTSSRVTMKKFHECFESDKKAEVIINNK